MEKILIKIKDNSQLDFFINLIKQLDFVEIEQASFEKKGLTKKHDFFSSAGLWKNRDIDAAQVRREAWKMNR